MINSSLRSVRVIHSPYLIASNNNLTQKFGHKASVIKFRRVTVSAQTQSDQNEMDNKAKPNKESEKSPDDKTGDVMSHSFGEGYSSRCNDDGFGGIYGGNETITKNPQDHSCIHENHPEYDKTQGSEVKEKEKARFQKSTSQ